jgi:6-phosphogluconate dehydrogenase
MTGLYDVGLIGLAVMGENLALNIKSKGYSIAVYNRTPEKTMNFLALNAESKNLGGAETIDKFVSMLQKPRKIIIMVKAGQPVDIMINSLLPHLDKGDILIDCGNSFFQDSRTRNEQLTEKGIRFLGVGVSGGEEGALKGPSIMAGGPADAFAEVSEMFTRIAAQVSDSACAAYCGPDGAGHYVKTVHNGIEYADMQLIAEVYDLMKSSLKLSTEDIANIFFTWNKGDLESYLIEITAKIFTRKDEQTNTPLVELVLDKAGQKGTGKWTSQSALDLGVPTPTITEAVFARCMSANKSERVIASKQIQGPQSNFSGDKQLFINALHDALYASKICCYAQGFALLKAASEEYSWSLNFGEMAMVWRGGCIIRAKFLDRIKEAFDRDSQLTNLMLDPFFLNILQNAQANWREVIKTAKELGIPTPALSASLDYFDAYRQENLPANLLQAQRDYFGAHTYERKDMDGVFHTEWLK